MPAAGGDDAPPIFSFSGRRKRENGPCTVQKRKRLLYLAEVRSFDRRVHSRFNAWTQGLCHWSRAPHCPVPSGKEGSSTGGRTAVLPVRAALCAKHGKRRKSLRQRIKFPVRPSIEARHFREDQNVLFFLPPCTAHSLFSRKREKREWGVHLQHGRSPCVRPRPEAGYPLLTLGRMSLSPRGIAVR